MNDLGSNIKELRITRNMTQEQLANRLLITKSAISSYENGSRLPSYDILIKISAIFKVSIDGLLGLKSEHTIDVTELSHAQRFEIQNIVDTYTKYNAIRKIMNEKY